VSAGASDEALNALGRERLPPRRRPSAFFAKRTKRPDSNERVSAVSQETDPSAGLSHERERQ
jgi:hypothetical protein